jgi:integrase
VFKNELVYKFGAWRELIPDTCNPARKVKCVTISDYEPRVITPEEAHKVWSRLAQPENTLVLLVAVTGLRISEALGLKWSDIDPKAELIHVRRSWTMDREGRPKSRASRQRCLVWNYSPSISKSGAVSLRMPAMTTGFSPLFGTRGRLRVAGAFWLPTT